MQQLHKCNTTTEIFTSTWISEFKGFCSSHDLYPTYYRLYDSITHKETPLCVPEQRNQPLYWRPTQVLDASKGILNSNFMGLWLYINLTWPSLPEISLLLMYIYVQYTELMAVLYSLTFMYFDSIPWHPSIKCIYQDWISFKITYKVHVRGGKRTHRLH